MSRTREVNVDQSQPKPEPTAAEAAPQGIGGWLLLPLLGLFITPLLVGSQVAQLVKLLAPEPWRQLTTPSSSAYHPFYQWLIPAEVVVNALLVLFALVLLILFFRKSPRLPPLICVFYLSVAAIVIVDTALAAQIPAFRWDKQAVQGLVRAIIGAAIWVPYFSMSKRVRNTFGRLAIN